MNLRNLLFCPVIGLSFLVSCSNETAIGEVDNPPGKEVKDADVDTFLELELYSRTSYSDNLLPGENTIRGAGIHIFNEDGTRDSITPYIFVNEEKRVFTVGVVPGQKTVIVTANFNSDDLLGYNLSVWEDLVFKKDISNPLGSANTAGSINTAWQGIPLSGRGSGYARKGEIITISVDGTRLLSRINSPTTNNTVVALSSDEKERLEEETGITFKNELTFTLDGYIMINGAKSYKLFPRYGVEHEYERWNLIAWMETQSYEKTKYQNGQLISAYSGSEFLTSDTAIYVYENTPRIANYDNDGRPVFERDGVYAFLLKGTLQDEAGSSATRYWRLDIAGNSIFNGHPVATHQVLRNAVYTTNIQKVLTCGYNTPEEAEEGNLLMEAEVIVISWDKHEIITDM